MASPSFSFYMYAVGNKEPVRNMQEKITMVRLETTAGDITLKLYNETPGHRDNFVRNVREGAYDGVLFHRVIKDFMVQTGDPVSRNARKGQMLGASDYGDEIPAEFVYPKFFHKKGAIAAARTGDNINPEKKSSGSQFYIVVGKKYNLQELVQLEKSMQQRQMQSFFDSLASAHRKEIMELRRARNSAGLQALQEELIKQTEDSLKGKLVRFTDEQREAYTTVGGTPFLDGAYTVYGEVTSGMDVIEKIQSVATDSNDRPLDDVRIVKAVLLDD
ncbi:MAG: peptidylprolyl isomerase [Bacteroidetes bacterium]|uniref:peptidylprolyl isomerase n=1 Tax=Candidatus Limisoma faecipullorum TaxID=2840854 RepID=A0A9D9IMB7_9BACT|nr:peptidylprolyl isomerase [Candidatus Limisoma faecipullorum]